MKKSDKMKIELYYKDNVYTLEQDEDWDVIYNYTEGNFSCDCNRGIMIGEELDCNQTGHNEIKIKIYADNGKVIYNELAEE